ncbi:Rne/Rng family ribonuclease [Leisingera sp. S232]|uniref:Rne/Rng family ribonuclease n=1 Tax=Leisingera sp. S232 TaxID=3415132 RepID=UPI003C7A9E8A
MAKKMLIDATHAEETRVVVVDGNKVEEFDFESENKRQLAGNIYLAKVTRVEPSLQAAFVDYGGNRHGFLAFSEIHPDYYQIPVADREALMEEERAYAEAMRARDEEEETKPAKPKRARRSKSSAKAAKATSDDVVETKEVEAADGQPAEIAGMETIDLTDSTEATGDPAADLAEVPEGSSPMETVAETPVEEPEETEAPAKAAEVEAADAPAEADASEADAEDVAAPAQDVAADAETESAEQAEASASETSETAADETADAEASAPSGDSDDGDDDDSDVARRADATSKDENIESVADEDDSDDIRPPRKPRPRRYKIQEVIKVRQVLLVQVVKEERGNKGAALTTYLSLAGRYCVLMPNTARGGGISRKITNAADRKKLKDIATELDVPTGAGLIVRTAGAKRTKSEIKRDYEYLQRMWEQIRELTLQSIAPAKIYEEGDLIKRSIRDLYSREIDEVLVEGDRGYRIAKDFMKMIMPSHAKNVKHYQEALPLFARFQVESYLAGMFNPTVQLKSGGYIVIGVTEALVAIDVNSGRATKQGSIEETALNTNLEAAEEVARQLRLRDLAGLIVIDFIDMDERKNNAAVEKRMKDKLKTDRARIQVGRISGFGLMEMSRQRLRPGMIEATTAPCAHCHGTGLIRSDDSMALSILRQIEEEGTRRRSREVLVRCPVSIANFLMNQKREHIAQIEARYGLSVRIEGDAHLVSPDFVLEKFKTASRTIPVATAPVVSVDTSIMDQVDAEEASQDEEETAVVAEVETPAEEAAQDDKPKRKRRRRRRRKGGNGEQSQNGETGETSESGDETSDDQKQTKEEAAEPSEAAAEGEDAPAEEVKEKKRSRTRTRSRKPKAKPAETEAATGEDAAAAEAATQEAVSTEPSEEPAAAADAAEAPVTEAAEVASGSVAASEVTKEAEAATVQEEAPVQLEAPAEAEGASEESAEEAAEAVSEVKAEPVADEADAPAADEPVADEPVTEEPVTEEAASAEPAAVPQEKQPEPEPALAAAEAQPEPAAPPKPKRRGWWSMGG